MVQKGTDSGTFSIADYSRQEVKRKFYVFDSKRVTILRRAMQNMEKIEAKKYLKMLAENVAISFMPGGVSGVASTAKEIKDGKEMDKRFAKLEEYAGSIQKTLPIFPIAIEIENVSAIIFYLLREIENVEEEALESDLHALSDDLGLGIESLEIEKNYIAVNLMFVTEKEEVNNTVEEIKTVFTNYDLKVRAIAYA